MEIVSTYDLACLSAALNMISLDCLISSIGESDWPEEDIIQDMMEIKA